MKWPGPRRPGQQPCTARPWAATVQPIGELQCPDGMDQPARSPSASSSGKASKSPSTGERSAPALRPRGWRLRNTPVHKRASLVPQLASEEQRAWVSWPRAHHARPRREETSRPRPSRSATFDEKWRGSPAPRLNPRGPLDIGDRHRPHAPARRRAAAASLTRCAAADQSISTACQAEIGSPRGLVLCPARGGEAGGVGPDVRVVVAVVHVRIWRSVSVRLAVGLHGAVSPLEEQHHDQALE